MFVCAAAYLVPQPPTGSAWRYPSGVRTSLAPGSVGEAGLSSRKSDRMSNASGLLSTTWVACATTVAVGVHADVVAAEVVAGTVYVGAAVVLDGGYLLSKAMVLGV